MPHMSRRTGGRAARVAERGGRRSPCAGVHPAEGATARSALRGRPRPDRAQGRPVARRGRDRRQRGPGPRRVPPCRRAGGRQPGAVRTGHGPRTVRDGAGQFTQHARNPAKSVVHRRRQRRVRTGLRLALRADLDGGRRYAHDRGLPQLREADVRQRPGCTTPAARSANRSTCRSTSATSTWSTPTCATSTRAFIGSVTRRSGPTTRSRWRASCSATTSSTPTA